MMNTNERLMSCSSPTIVSGGLITEKFLKSVPPVNLAFAFNVQKAI